MAKTKKIDADSWQISGARTFTAVGNTAKDVAKKLVSNVDSDVTSILLRVNLYDAPDVEFLFDGDITFIR
jgi:hypothetical protein